MHVLRDGDDGRTREFNDREIVEQVAARSDEGEKYYFYGNG